jgi:hypothetical protein
MNLTNGLTVIGSSCVAITPGGSATANGAALLAAYTIAKAMTPNGASLSAANRAAVVLFPGVYDLGASTLTLDAQYVDIIGLDKSSCRITADGTVAISKSANDVVVSRVRVKAVVLTATGAAERWEDVQVDGAFNSGSFDFAGNYTRMPMGTLGGSALSGRFTDITCTTVQGNCTGTFTRVVATNSFNDQTASPGTFIDCRGGDQSWNVPSGTFIRCIAGASSFGINADASGTFTDCSAGDYSFSGAGGTSATGTFTRCIAGVSSFGSDTDGFGGVVASGTFTDCIGGSDSFGGLAATASGTFRRCSMTGLEWTGTFTGVMDSCNWTVTGTDKTALTVGAGATLRLSTLTGTGSGKSVDAGSAVSIELSGCVLNLGKGSNVTTSSKFAA